MLFDNGEIETQDTLSEKKKIVQPLLTVWIGTLLGIAFIEYRILRANRWRQTAGDNSEVTWGRMRIRNAKGKLCDHS